MHTMRKNDRLFFSLILLAYAVLALLYAACTPPWQVPDEPAHYNYVRAIVEEGRLPVIEEGDYDHAYIRRLVDNGFPPDLSVEPLTYEDHQPPLYYLLLTPIYLLFHGALFPLRAASVALGGLLLLITWRLACTLFPDRPLPALAATAFVAFLPQHLAMVSGVNNDSLAEVMVGLALLMGVRLTAPGGWGNRRLAWGLGVVLGLALLTKTTAYVTLPVALLAVGLGARRGRASPREAAAQLVRVFLPPLLLAAPWLARNLSLYGWADPLGLARHNGVVVGQPRTAEWLAQYGWAGLLGRMARTTFQSFWGQFGWMGVPLQPSIYQALALFSGLLLAGLVGWGLDQSRSGGKASPAAFLLATSALLTVGSYLWYNLTFVQHQGRYLFPALIPLAVGAAAGLEWLLSPLVAPRTAAVLAGAGALLIVLRAMGVGLSFFPVGTAFGLAALLEAVAFAPHWGRWLALVGIVAGLAALDLYSLFGAIIPTLTR